MNHANTILSKGVSFISIVTDNAAWNWEKARTRYDSIFTAIRHHGIENRSELLCIDNSERPLRAVEKYFLEVPCPPRTDYEWCQGFNLTYGLAINRMVARARYPTVVYFCTNHGRFFDPTWLSDLVAPLTDDFCAMAGSLAHCRLDVICEPTGALPNVHVQGGFWAAKTAVLRQYPYSYRFPHVFSDLWITWKLQTEGYEVSDVPTIKATGGERVNDPERFKYVHDHFV